MTVSLCVCMYVGVCVWVYVGVHAHSMISSQSKLRNDGDGDDYVPLCMRCGAELCCCMPCV